MNAQVNTQERLIALPNSKFSTVIRLRISLRCNECGATWGTNFLHDWSLPIGFDVCHACQAKKRLDVNSDSVGSDDKGE